MINRFYLSFCFLCFIFFLFALILSGCAAYRDIDLGKITTGMTVDEVKYIMGHKRNFLFEKSGLVREDSKIVILEYGNNPVLNKGYAKMVVNKKYNKLFDCGDRYWLYFCNDTLLQLKWGQSLVWDSDSELNEFETVTNAYREKVKRGNENVGGVGQINKSLKSKHLRPVETKSGDKRLDKLIRLENRLLSNVNIDSVAECTPAFGHFVRQSDTGISGVKMTVSVQWGGGVDEDKLLTFVRVLPRGASYQQVSSFLQRKNKNEIHFICTGKYEIRTVSRNNSLSVMYRLVVDGTVDIQTRKVSMSVRNGLF